MRVFHPAAAAVLITVAVSWPLRGPAHSAALPAIAVIVQVTTTGATLPRGELEGARDATAAAVVAAFRDRGATMADDFSARDTTSLGSGSAYTACFGTRSGDSADCIRVMIRMTLAVTGGHQTVTGTWTASAVAPARTLHTSTIRVGPYAMDVPSSRVIDRAARNVVDEFADGTVAAYGSSDSP